MKHQPLPYKTLRETAFQLLEQGQGIDQIAATLNVPIGKIYYWRRYYMKTAQPLTDGRRLYNDQFKQAALDQVDAGISVTKLAQLLGVSKVTLFKWKKERNEAHQLTNEAQTVEVPTGSKLVKSKEPVSAQNITDDLLERIRVLEEEKSILRKALQILACSMC
ncbi:transposase [Spirosoma endophyticum]|nr:transposase [Spirosoma endophyticum]